MKQPTTHEKAHPRWPHKWNPYASRDYVMWMFDKRISDRLLSFDGWVDGEYDCWACGCIDAPEDIPLGATASIKTLGGYYREEYRTLSRHWDSWNSYIRASNETAEMLKGILEEVK